MNQHLTVLAVGSDRQDLRQLSRFLKLCEFKVWATHRCSDATRVLQATPPDFLIVDDRLDEADRSSLVQCSRSPRCGRFSYRFMLVEDPTHPKIRQALGQGFEDFLHRPLDYGEILARLRAAARIVESERRLRSVSFSTRFRQHSRNLLPAEAWRDRLSTQLEQQANSNSTFSVALVDVDLLDCINRQFGWLAGDEVCQALALELVESSSEDARSAELRPGRFAVTLPGLNETEAAAWVEQLGPLDIETDRAAEFQVTMSGAVLEIDRQHDAEQVLLELEQTLQEAKISGRNCTIRCGTLDHELNEWRTNANEGSLFTGTHARDLMEYCPAVLCVSDSAAQAAELFELSRLLRGASRGHQRTGRRPDQPRNHAPGAA